MAKTVFQILAENLKRLMEQTEGMHSQSAVARGARMDQRTVGRILRNEHKCSLQQVDRLARAFKVPAWLLLVENLDPANRPVAYLTQAQHQAYSAMEQGARAVLQITTPK